MGEFSYKLREAPNALQRFCLRALKDYCGIIGETILFRCFVCHRIVAANQILESGKCSCGGRKFFETNLSLSEEIYWVGRSLVWRLFKK